MKIWTALFGPGLIAAVTFAACSSPNPGGHSTDGASERKPVSAITTAPKVTSAATAPGDPARGRALYDQGCSICHEKGIGPDVRGTFRRPSLPSGTPANDDRVRDVITMGRATMPGFANVYNGQQIRDIIAFMHEF